MKSVAPSSPLIPILSRLLDGKPKLATFSIMEDKYTELLSDTGYCFCVGHRVDLCSSLLQKVATSSEVPVEHWSFPVVIDVGLLRSDEMR